MIPCSDSADRLRFQWPEDDLSPEDAESFASQLSHEDNERRHPIRDFLSLTFRDYCSSHPVTEDKLKAVNSMMACKTGKLGYTLLHCKSCGKIEMRACACGNRNCPSCGYLNEKKWVALRQAEVLPGIPYFHMIFTLPHELNTLMLHNQKETLNLLFRSVRDTILELCRDKLKMVPGILMVLHSFGSNLSLHYHLHVLVTGGGLSLDQKKFMRCLSNKFFLPLKAVTTLYRGKFLSGLGDLREQKRLSYYNDAQKYRNSYTWRELIDVCYGIDWNVEIRYLAPVSQNLKEQTNTETTDNAITYFARYTNRTAISDSRVEDFDCTGIRFKYKDYSHGTYEMKTMHLDADEFIRRFLMHILPPRFSRIRWAGFFAGCVRQKKLELINTLLDSVYKESPVKKMSSVELLKYFYNRDITVCQSCHAPLTIRQRIDRHAVANYIRAS